MNKKGNSLSEISYRIKLRRNDFEVEVQGDKLWVESKFKELITEKASVVGLGEIARMSMPETLGEFMDQKGNPEKHTDVAAVYAYWLFKVEGMKSFNVKDITSCYDSTRKPKQSNPNMTINQNVATHLFAEAPEKKDGYKAWIITRTGEKYIEQMK